MALMVVWVGWVQRRNRCQKTAADDDDDTVSDRLELLEE